MGLDFSSGHYEQGCMGLDSALDIVSEDVWVWTQLWTFQEGSSFLSILPPFENTAKVLDFDALFYPEMEKNLALRGLDYPVQCLVSSAYCVLGTELFLVYDNEVFRVGFKLLSLLSLLPKYQDCRHSTTGLLKPWHFKNNLVHYGSLLEPEGSENIASLPSAAVTTQRYGSLLCREHEAGDDEGLTAAVHHLQYPRA
ncbi:hypothetical protein STEG23_015714 [Scotinomys teguina]